MLDYKISIHSIKILRKNIVKGIYENKCDIFLTIFNYNHNVYNVNATPIVR